MNYCCSCGAPVREAIPDGDNRLRHVCDSCGMIHYQNPKIITGCLPFWQNKVLLCRRAIEPRLGLWTLPAGFMEKGETLFEAASREAMEEANVQLRQGQLYAIFNLPHISQVHVFFLCPMHEMSHFAGEESLETALFHEDEIPWDDLAFTTVRRTLRLFLDDRRTETFPIHHEDVTPEIALR